MRRINFVQAFDWCQRAEQWFLKSAKQGHADAQFMLYKVYSLNMSAEYQNKANFWLRQARASQYPLAMETK